ncbi:MAG: hypothetical protein JWN34_1926 [Bryobacterales bacterium]|jgi:hypothetical protein|nr:hypothetical protein [Bryobacterales bacterium]
MLESVQTAQMPTNKLILAMQAAAYAYTAWRLFARGLGGRQSGLFGFLLFRCAFMLSSALLPERSHLYFWTYVILMPLDCVVSVVAVREAIGLVLDDYPGLRSVGRITMYGAVVVSTLSAVLIAAAFWREHIPSNLYYVQVSTRSAGFGLAVILMSLLIFLSHYPLSLTRNRLLSSVAFGAIFLSEAAALFIDSRSDTLRSPAVDLASVAFGAVCLVIWGTFLESKTVEVPAKSPDGPDDERLLLQLRSLEEMARKLGQSRA